MKKELEQTHHLFAAKKKKVLFCTLFLYFHKSYKKNSDAVDDIVITIEEITKNAKIVTKYQIFFFF